MMSLLREKGSVFVHSSVDNMGKGLRKKLWVNRGRAVESLWMKFGQLSSSAQALHALPNCPQNSPHALPGVILTLSTRAHSNALDSIRLFLGLSPLSTQPITTTTINIYKK